MRGDEPVRQGVRGHLHGRDIAGQHDHGNAPLAHRVLHGGLQHARHLAGVGDELAVVAALAEKLVGVGLLEVAGADLGAGDVGGDGQHRGHAAVGVEQPVDEVQVAGAAAAGADRQLAGELGLRPGREGRGLFVADVHPLDLAATADGVGHRVEAVADDPVNALDAGFGKGVNQVFCHGPGHDLSPV